MKCEKCGSENVVPSFTIPTFKCLDCGHVTQGLEHNKNEALENFAIKFSDVMNEYAIAGSINAEQAIDDLWELWSETILPLMPFQSSTQKVNEE